MTEMSGHEITMTIFQFTVLHRTDNQPATLEDALAETDTGDAVGSVRVSYSTQLHPSVVPDELRKLGNDGTFFEEN